MKSFFEKLIPANQGWNGRTNIFHRLFTWVTGYEILFAESREDLEAEKTSQQ